MKPLISLLLLGASASYGAISVSTSSISYVVRSGQTVPASRAFLPPKNETITVTSSGPWTVALSLGLSTACRYSGPCLMLSQPFDDVSVTGGSGGTPVTLNVNWNLGNMLYQNPGTYTGLLTFSQGANTATTTITIYARDDTVFPTDPAVKELSRGAEAGCSAQANSTLDANYTGAMFTYANLCGAAPNEAPNADPALTEPAVGGSYTDATFGGVITRYTGAGAGIEYGGISPFSTDDKYLLTSNGVYNIATKALTRSQASYPLSFNITDAYMSALLPDNFYATIGSKVYRYNYVTNATPTLIGDLSAAPYYMTTLYEGGTQGTTERDWQAFFDRGTFLNVALSNTVGVKTFTISNGTYPVGTKILISSSGNADKMIGLVTSAVGSAITVNATSATGSGTTTTGWNIDRYNTRICVLNLPLAEAQGFNTSNTFCGDYDPSGAPGFPNLNMPDWVQVTEVDVPTGKRFVYLSQEINQGNSSIAGSAVFHVGPAGSGQIIQDYIVPEWPQNNVNNDNGICEAGERCLNAQNYTHNISCQDADGQIWMFGKLQSVVLTNPRGNLYYMGWVRLSAGTDLFRPIEAGGGMRMVNMQQWDIQPSCSSRVHAWGLSLNPELDSEHFASVISNASYSPIAGGTVTMDLVNEVTWSGTLAVRIANATGSWAPLNGTYTATKQSGTTVSVLCSVCSGGSGAVGTGAAMGDTLPDRQIAYGDRIQLQVYRPGKSLNRLAVNRDVNWQYMGAPCSDNYTNVSTRGALSRSGKLMAWNSNYGTLACEGPSVYVVTTGLDPSILTGMTVQPAATNAVLSYNVTDLSACSTELSARGGFSTLVRTISDPGGTAARNYSLGTLTASTNYWTRTTCGQQVESTTFTTLPAGGSTRSITTRIGTASGISGLDNVVLDYRVAGTAPWTSVSSVSCVSGCSVSWPGPVGVAEYQINYRNASNTVLRTSAASTMNIFPSTGAAAALSWATLTSSQWAALTSVSWSTLTQ